MTGGSSSTDLHNINNAVVHSTLHPIVYLLVVIVDPNLVGIDAVYSFRCYANAAICMMHYIEPIV